jgi:glycosyltransferase involved in cell wall biosynthesis
MTIWFDVEDLITYFQHVSRPTGIQRLTFEIYRELWKAAGASGKVRFCRHGTTPADYIVVDWPNLEAGILATTAASLEEKQGKRSEPLLAELEMAAPMAETGLGAPEPGAPHPAAPETAASGITPLSFRGRVHHYLYPRITPTLRRPLGVLYASQKQSLLALRDLSKAMLVLLAAPRTSPAKLGDVTIRLTTEPVQFQPDDVFVSLGASWGLLNAAPGRAVQKHYGLRHAVLIHDLVPELYPEWTSREGLPAYRAWLRDVVPHADAIFAYSQHSAKDLVQHMALWSGPVPTPVVLPVGHRPPARPASRETVKNPFDRPFILFVSTIEVRKNHALLFRVWRRLLSSMPAGQVPYLVFAGKVAWMTGDLMTQLENAGWLNGHIKLIESPAEPELMALYETCEFTVFPSLYEGWGLPVTESLSFGKTVAASNRSAIPEAGGDFCTYFDPENVEDAYAVIRGLIENPERVRALEARIAERFRPPSWADTAAVLLEHLGAAAHGPAEAPKKTGKVKVAA